MVSPVKNKGKDVICWWCNRPAYEHCYSDAGRREVGISGMCEECFDKLTMEPKEVVTSDEE